MTTNIVDHAKHGVSTFHILCAKEIKFFQAKLEILHNSFDIGRDNSGPEVGEDKQDSRELNKLQLVQGVIRQ